MEQKVKKITLRFRAVNSSTFQVVDSKKFQRRKEDFRCKQCGFFVGGTGYTNHCPRCLWSRHVDVNPGDRAQKCKGMMEPIGIEIRGGAQHIIHRCAKCHIERRNKVVENDSAEEIVTLGAVS